MYSAMQLHLPAAASHFGVEDMSAAASTSGSPIPMSYYHHHHAAAAAQYAPVPALPQELMVDPSLYYQDHGHGQLHPMPFVTVDVGRADSPLSQDALSSGSHSPYAHSPYGTPEWQPAPVPSTEAYYLPPAFEYEYEWAAHAAAAYPAAFDDARAQLTINTSMSVSYTAPAGFYSHPSSATSASSGSPVSFNAPSPLSSEPEAAPKRAPASGPARGGRRKPAAAAGSPGAPKKVHKCTLCQKTMSRNYDLHRHLLSVHGLGDRVDADGVDRKAGWCCHACGKCFSRKDSMQRHQRDDGCRAQGPSSRDASTDRDEHLHLHLGC